MAIWLFFPGTVHTCTHLSIYLFGYLATPISLLFRQGNMAWAQAQLRESMVRGQQNMPFRVSNAASYAVPSC